MSSKLVGIYKRYSNRYYEPNQPPDTCSYCNKSNPEYDCARCKVKAYCSQECATKDKSDHAKECDINKARSSWWSLQISQSTSPHLPYRLAYPDKSNWKEVQYPTKQDIKQYMITIRKSNSQRDEAILSTHETTAFSNDIYRAIIDFLPVFKDETQDFFDQYPDEEYSLSLDNYHNPAPVTSIGDIKKRVDWGTGFINRFLMSTELLTLDEARNTDMNLGIRERLQQWIEYVYWFRMGEEVKWNKGRKPADIVGALKNGKYFYYKDAYPTDFAQYGVTHDKYFYLIADDMQSLFKLMDKRDIELFLSHKKKWSEISKDRCDLQFGFVHVASYTSYNYGK